MSPISRRAFLQVSAFTVASGFSRTEEVRLKADTTTVETKALVFDVFGTVVDWRTSVALEVQQLAKRKGLTVDGEKFADAWRAGYGPSMNRVRTGELPWTKLDDLHRMTLDRILGEFNVPSLTDAEKSDLNRAWHRLRPWPDTVAGLTRLKKKFVIAPLSNGNVSLLTDVAKFGSLPWDLIIGADLSKHYKPDREVYLTAASLLERQPQQIMMVAAHQDDLRAARGVGFRTAFVPRPKEGPNGDHRPIEPGWDLVVNDFGELATKLGS